MEFEPNVTLQGVKLFFCPLCKKNFEEFGIKDEKTIDISNHDGGYNTVLIESTDIGAIGAFIATWASDFKQRFLIDYDPAFPGRAILRIVNEDCDTRSSDCG